MSQKIIYRSPNSDQDFEKYYELRWRILRKPWGQPKISNEVPDQSFSQVDSMAKSLAKSLSIKVGVSLGRKEQEDLVNRLFSCKEPNYSPFGKKTYITISMDDLEKKFNA